MLQDFITQYICAPPTNLVENDEKIMKKTAVFKKVEYCIEKALAHLPNSQWFLCRFIRRNLGKNSIKYVEKRKAFRGFCQRITFFSIQYANFLGTVLFLIIFFQLFIIIFYQID